VLSLDPLAGSGDAVGGASAFRLAFFFSSKKIISIESRRTPPQM